jgi:hypothetical protein
MVLSFSYLVASSVSSSSESACPAVFIEKSGPNLSTTKRQSTVICLKENIENEINSGHEVAEMTCLTKSLNYIFISYFHINITRKKFPQLRILRARKPRNKSLTEKVFALFSVKTVTKYNGIQELGSHRDSVDRDKMFYTFAGFMSFNLIRFEKCMHIRVVDIIAAAATTTTTTTTTTF